VFGVQTALARFFSLHFAQNIRILEDVVNKRKYSKQNGKADQNKPYIHVEAERQVDYQRKAHDHLDDRFDLSEPAGGNNAAFLQGSKTEAADYELSCDYHDRGNAGKRMEINKDQDCRAHKKLVRKRIHELSEIGDQFVFAGYIAVKRVCKACKGKDPAGDPPVAGYAVNIHCRYEKRYQDDAKKRQFIG
jgi:hypothetical protein